MRCVHSALRCAVPSWGLWVLLVLVLLLLLGLMVFESRNLGHGIKVVLLSPAAALWLLPPQRLQGNY